MSLSQDSDLIHRNTIQNTLHALLLARPDFAEAYTAAAVAFGVKLPVVPAGQLLIEMTNDQQPAWMKGGDAANGKG